MKVCSLLRPQLKMAFHFLKSNWHPIICIHSSILHTYTNCLPFKKMCNPQMIIAALDFGSAAICNTDYLEVYDAFLSGGGGRGGGGGGSTASRRLITRYCGNVSRKLSSFAFQVTNWVFAFWGSTLLKFLPTLFFRWRRWHPTILENILLKTIDIPYARPIKSINRGF